MQTRGAIGYGAPMPQHMVPSSTASFGNGTHTLGPPPSSSFGAASAFSLPGTAVLATGEFAGRPEKWPTELYSTNSYAHGTGHEYDIKR
jgi:hypothetical protein